MARYGRSASNLIVRFPLAVNTGYSKLRVPAIGVLLTLCVLGSTGCSSEPSILRAVKAGDVVAVRQLLESGADPNLKVNKGSTPLFFAASYGRDEIATLLLNAGARVNDQNDEGATALIWAAPRGHVPTVDVLLSRNADVNAKSNYGFTALMAAASKGHVDVVRRLIAAGAQIDTADSEGRTCLIWALLSRHSISEEESHRDVELVTELIRSGVSVNAKMKDGLTPLMAATANSYTPIVRILLESGAHPQDFDSNGRTALDFAGGNTDKYELLKRAIDRAGQ